jgi:hypothetical protein
VGCDEITLEIITKDYSIVPYYEKYTDKMNKLVELIHHLYHYKIRDYAKSLFYRKLFVKYSKDNKWIESPYLRLGSFYIHCDSSFKSTDEGIKCYVDGYNNGEMECLIQLAHVFSFYKKDYRVSKHYAKLGSQCGFINCHKCLKYSYDKLYKVPTKIE